MEIPLSIRQRKKKFGVKTLNGSSVDCESGLMFLTGHHRKSQSGRFWTTVYRSRHIDQWTLRMIDDIIRLARHVPTAPQSGEISNGHRHTHTCRYTHGVMEEQQLYRALLYTCLSLCVCPSAWHRAASVKSVYTVWTTQNSHTYTHTEGENERERDRERGKEKGKRRGERHRWKVRERQREKVGSVALPSVH